MSSSAVPRRAPPRKPQSAAVSLYAEPLDEILSITSSDLVFGRADVGNQKAIHTVWESKKPTMTASEDIKSCGKQ